MTDRDRVMVVDDDALMRDLYGEALGDAFALSFAVDGLDALRQLEAGPLPAAIVMDVAMNGLDGYETCRQLRQQFADAPPVLFVSSHDQLDDRMRGYDAGGSDYLCKPVDAVELETKIRLQIRAEAQRRALNAERDEAVMAVLSSADMAGELGVVLDFQRGLNGCTEPTAALQLLFDALARYGFDGCARLHAGGQAISRASDGPCTTLEQSILDALEAASAGPRIRPFSSNTSFNFGRVVLFVRQLAMQRGADMDEEARQRHGRAIDNIALLLEAMVARLEALDALGARRDLDATRRLIDVASQTLREVSRRNESMATEVQEAFQHLQEELNESFIHLGLTSRQEDLLSELVKSHGERVLAVLAQGRETETSLQQVIADLRGPR